MKVSCPYCSKEAELVNGSVIYPHRSDLHWRSYWYCFADDAYVGCHPHTNDPLGILANKELRREKINAHRFFDRLWRTPGGLSRTQAYRWLSSKMKIPKEETPIGMFTLEQCKQVVKLCRDVNLEQLAGSRHVKRA